MREGRVRVCGDFIWPSSGDLEHVRTPDAARPETERRVEHVPRQELDVAMAHVAAEAVAASADQLTESVSRVFGWRRRGPDISAALAAAVERLIAAGRLEEAGDALRWVGEPPANHRVRRVTDQVVEPRPVEPAPVRPVPAPSVTRAPEPSPSPASTAPRQAAIPRLPSDLDRCLTAEGHQDRLKDLRLAEEQLLRARQAGEVAEVTRVSAKVDSLQRLLAEVRVLPPPASNKVVTIGCLVSFREEDGPEETWQLVPPLEGDTGTNRMSALTPIGQALFGRTAGDMIEVKTPGGVYLVEVIAIEVP
jgi:transcription elongation GreA/GreB family factor